MAEPSNPEPCPICKEDIDNDSEISKIGQKGANGIYAASTERGDRIVVETGVKVHAQIAVNAAQTYSDLKEN